MRFWLDRADYWDKLAKEAEGLLQASSGPNPLPPHAAPPVLDLEPIMAVGVATSYRVWDQFAKESDHEAQCSRFGKCTSRCNGCIDFQFRRSSAIGPAR